MGSYLSSPLDSRNNCKSKREANRANTKLAIANSERAACMAEVAKLQTQLRDAEELESMLISLLSDMAGKTKSCQQNRSDVRKWRSLVHSTVEKLRSTIAKKEAEAKRL